MYLALMELHPLFLSELRSNNVSDKDFIGVNLADQVMVVTQLSKMMIYLELFTFMEMMVQDLKRVLQSLLLLMELQAVTIFLEFNFFYNS